MTKYGGLIVALCMVASCVSADLDPQKRYTVLGKYISIEEKSQDTSRTDAENDDAIKENLSTAIVVISQETEDASGETRSVELARRTFSNGSVKLEGEINEPTVATIVVRSNNGESLSTRTLLEPGKVVSFIVLDNQEKFAQDWLVIEGTLKLTSDPTKRFTIVGDLTGVDEHYPSPMVLVHGPHMTKRVTKRALCSVRFRPKTKDF